MTSSSYRALGGLLAFAVTSTILAASTPRLAATPLRVPLAVRAGRGRIAHRSAMHQHRDANFEVQRWPPQAFAGQGSVSPAKSEGGGGRLGEEVGTCFRSFAPFTSWVRCSLTSLWQKAPQAIALVLMPTSAKGTEGLDLVFVSPKEEAPTRLALPRSTYTVDVMGSTMGLALPSLCPVEVDAEASTAPWPARPAAKASTE
eukprot:CAMPEP_0171277234 /NCGR_PEP_ID=MMETSP0790-20130122/64246_1 /TAXON_ID=2925 /ORGANISM="Alexandrium catenella, Strain OF101" /LENGTH=200 /DNA_ID=CAMNT_0011746349 /DNA_START=523 /DNA_END=1123 /DNA_ORIENTATION=-